MTTRRNEDPWRWLDRDSGVAVCFAGAGPAELELAIRRLVDAGVEPAWLRQVHSADVLDAVPGCAGEADALVTRRRGLALAIVTADCVPVLLAGPRELGAAHAGWRGVAGRVVPATLERLGAPSATVTAWIGPAIGRCCYEVGDDVAARVVAAVRSDATSQVVHPGPAERPHLDLRRAVEDQLREMGVTRIRHVEKCTRCEPRLASYRREGPRAGRNLALIWSSPVRHST